MDNELIADTETVTDVTDVTAAAALTHASGAGAANEIADELLIEEISIDGMCGVY